MDQRPNRKSLSEFRKEDEVVRQALRLRDEGKLEEAIEIFLDLARRYPRVAGPRGMLGGLYNELGRHKEAAEYYGDAVEINPYSELANRGLFNALFSLGEEARAIEVIRNYKSISNSDAFDDILEAYRKREEAYGKCDG